MKNQVKKSEEQVKFFKMIQKNLPANLVLVDVISDLLNVGTNASYCRIRGAKLLDFDEIMILCKHFHISLDPSGISDNKQFQCNYMPLDLKDLNNYKAFVQTIHANLDNFISTHRSEIILSAVDIPLFSIMSHKELTYFKLFSWSKNVYGFSSKYEDFVKEIEAHDLHKNYHEKIARKYQLIPSSEIWTAETIDPILRLLLYHSEMTHFDDNKFPLFLCEQLLELINTLENWSEQGIKNSNGAFKFYVSEINSGNTYVLFKNAETSNCMVRLFTINGLRIFDKHFCKETEKWLRNLASRATLISESSEKERCKFFNGQRQKIKLLIEKIQLT